MTQTENITQMENRLNTARAALDELSVVLEKYESLQAEIAALDGYYGSRQWFQDLDDHSAGRLPKGLKCGVLSEDAVYDLLCDNRAILEKMREIERRGHMTYEVSCGAVVFTRIDGEIKYVIIKSTEGFYGFPKGHVEPGETEEETALREILEETGLRVTILPGFRTIDEHGLPKKPDVIKRIIYFAAKYSGQEIHYQEEELSEAELMGFDEAMSAFQFESSRRILQEVNDFLTNRG